MKEINTIIDKIQSKQIQKLENRLKSKDKILIGKTIKFYRLYYNISQKELARRLWTSFQTIQKYERGIYRITPYKLIKICRAIGISEEQFIDTVDNVDELMDIINKNY